MEVIPYLLAGFLISGLVHEFLPGKIIQKHLGEKGFLPIFYATFFGSVLPICCIGSLPVAVSMRKKGAGLGPVLAFLAATPATSISALIVSYALLGWHFTLFIFFAVIVMGIILGFVGNRLKIQPEKKVQTACPYKKGTARDPICGMEVDRCKGIHTKYKGRNFFFCSTHCLRNFEDSPEIHVDEGEKGEAVKKRVLSVLHYAFIEMPRDMGLEILLGLALAALVVSVTPIGRFVGETFGGAWAYVFAMPFGILMYICSTASVPLVDALITQGMNNGAGMMLLMVGPVTSFGTLLVVRKEFGVKAMSVYLSVICAVSLLLGILYSVLF